jgi:hypothetical protein
MDCTPRWENCCHSLAELLPSLVDACHRAVTKEPQGDWETLTRWYFSKEAETSKEVEQAVQHIAKTLTIPEHLSDEASMQLAMRIQCALDFSGMIFPPQAAASPISEIPESWTESDIYKWLLSDLWLRRHDHWLKLEALGARGPFAFYGIGPTPSDAEE